MRTIGHSAQAVDEYFAVRCERLNQVGEVFAFDNAGVFHAGDGIVAERKAAVFNGLEPFSEAAERERILLAGVDDGDGKRSAELRTAAFGDDGKRGRSDRRG